VVVARSDGTSNRHELAALELPVVKAEIRTFLTDVVGAGA